MPLAREERDRKPSMFWVTGVSHEVLGDWKHPQHGSGTGGLRTPSLQ